MQWPAIIENAIKDFDTFLKGGTWHGRENEVVNIFAHRFLANAISANGPLRSLRQIGVEVAVRQVSDSQKEYVRKDLVIWPLEDMTVWVGDGIPAVVMEWKRNNPRECAKDVEWLTNFCAKNPDTLGVSACAILTDPNRGCQIVAMTGLHQK